MTKLSLARRLQDCYATTMRVLVVEDERKIAGFIRHGLEEQGFVVEVCGDGNDAYTLATTRAYDVIVLDIMLPGRDGLSILKNLRLRKRILDETQRKRASQTRTVKVVAA